MVHSPEEDGKKEENSNPSEEEDEESIVTQENPDKNRCRPCEHKFLLDIPVWKRKSLSSQMFQAPGDIEKARDDAGGQR